MAAKMHQIWYLDNGEWRKAGTRVTEAATISAAQKALRITNKPQRVTDPDGKVVWNSENPIVAAPQPTPAAANAVDADYAAYLARQGSEYPAMTYEAFLDARKVDAPDANAVDAAPSFADLVRYNAEAHIANAHIETLDKLATADAENATLRARVEALEAALQPFAALYRAIGDTRIGNEVYGMNHAVITKDDLRRAAELTAAAQARGGEGTNS